ncbi:hypothetical protein F5148DRAFT_1217017 [Russula earlei]|uniref:Uncharacterized protein n=1 Tax=Russula earlei TaxID=71964 RepID=A0ACC0U332_9AGAM|nr:hypothetical protein F5148DRAFT_1217017 [Russula earlei]
MVCLSTLCLIFSTISLSVFQVFPQTPVPPPPCVQTCSQTAAQTAGCSATDVSCICSSDAFANSVTSCLVDQCTTADAEAGATYLDNLCSGVSSPSPTLSASSTIGSTPTSVNTVLSSLGPMNPAKQSTTAPTTTIAPSTTGSTASVVSPTSKANDSVNVRTCGLFSGIGFVLALAFSFFAL